MPRQFKLHDPDWGERLFYVIHEDPDGSWPLEWEPFRVLPELKPVSDLFSRVSNASYQDALRQYAMPLLKELGLPPEACLIKTPQEMIPCQLRKSCAMHDKKTCRGDKDEVPPCYQATVTSLEEGISNQVSRVFELWRLGFYILIVEPPI